MRGKEDKLNKQASMTLRDLQRKEKLCSVDEYSVLM